MGGDWRVLLTTLSALACQNLSLSFFYGRNAKKLTPDDEIDARRFSFLPNVLSLFHARDARPKHLG